MLTLFKSGAYMALKVDIWPPLPLETQTNCHLHGSLSGVSNAPPFCGNQKPPAWPPKTVLLVKKKATYMAPLIENRSGKRRESLIVLNIFFVFAC